MSSSNKLPASVGSIIKRTMARLQAIYETRDKQLIPLDDIQHINARYNEALKDEHQTLTILYKDGMVKDIAEASDMLSMESLTFKPQKRYLFRLV